LALIIIGWVLIWRVVIVLLVWILVLLGILGLAVWLSIWGLSIWGLVRLLIRGWLGRLVLLRIYALATAVRARGMLVQGDPVPPLVERSLLFRLGLRVWRRARTIYFDGDDLLAGRLHASARCPPSTAYIRAGF
jgi:hypothetical protein